MSGALFPGKENYGIGTEEKKTYTVGEIAEMLGISDKVAYTLVKSGQFKYVRVGRAIRVSKSSFDSWLEPN